MDDAIKTSSPAYRPFNIEKLALTVQETATVLGVSRSLVYRMIEAGEIPSLRLSSRILVPRKRLIAMINGSQNDEPISSNSSSSS